jgi:hypothetical protein
MDIAIQCVTVPIAITMVMIAALYARMGESVTWGTPPVFAVLDGLAKHVGFGWAVPLVLMEALVPQGKPHAIALLDGLVLIVLHPRPVQLDVHRIGWLTGLVILHVTTLLAILMAGIVVLLAKMEECVPWGFQLVLALQHGLAKTVVLGSAALLLVTMEGLAPVDNRVVLVPQAGLGLLVTPGQVVLHAKMEAHVFQGSQVVLASQVGQDPVAVSGMEPVPFVKMEELVIQDKQVAHANLGGGVHLVIFGEGAPIA